MSQFGAAQQAGEGTSRKIYTGVENFKVINVCPTHDELKAIYGENAKEDNYVLSTEVNNPDGSTETVPQVKIVLHLDNEAMEPDPSIKTRATFFVAKKYKTTTDGSKTQFINLYGRTVWLTEAEATNPGPIITLTGAKGAYHFDTTGMRKAYRGEEEVISMLRNLLNLTSPEKAKDKSAVASQFSEADWNTMFAGNFTMLKTVIASSPNKIGFLLGAKTVEDGNVYQDLYNRNTLRQYAKAGGNFNYLRKDVQSAQENGAYPNTNFGDPSYKLAEFMDDAVPTSNAAVAQGFGSGQPAPAMEFDASTANAFTPQN